MTISCPHKRLRVAASLAPTPGLAASAYAVDFLRRAVANLTRYQVDKDHKRLLELATAIVAGDQSEARWQELTAELQKIKMARFCHIGVDRASGPDIAVQWYQRGSMA